MNNKAAPGKLKDWATLCKLNISISVTVTAFTGYVIYAETLSLQTLYASLGVFLLACASSALNHIIEKQTDALMPRTRNRPIPTGRISTIQASIFVLLLTVSGSLLLVMTGLTALALGLFNLLWYAFVYTPLKKVTAFAVIPGSLIGAIPPVIGWAAAGGNILHPHIILIAFFFFMGQIPHFWLIVIGYGKDYEAAGLPSLTSILTVKQIEVMTLVWIAATAMSAILLVLAGIFKSFWLAIVMFVLVLILLYTFRNWLYSSRRHPLRPAFFSINLFYLAVMGILIINAFI